MGDECSPEVSSSSAEELPQKRGSLSHAVPTETSPPPPQSIVNPVHALTSSDIGEVDLEFWDLDINESPSNKALNDSSSGSGSGK